MFSSKSLLDNFELLGVNFFFFLIQQVLISYLFYTY